MLGESFWRSKKDYYVVRVPVHFEFHWNWLPSCKASSFGQGRISYLWGVWISDIRSFIKSEAIKDLVHVKRSTNVVANVIAYFASSSTLFSWMNEDFFYLVDEACKHWSQLTPSKTLPIRAIFRFTFSSESTDLWLIYGYLHHR